jgi:hypothetical protein
MNLHVSKVCRFTRKTPMAFRDSLGKFMSYYRGLVPEISKMLCLNLSVSLLPDNSKERNFTFFFSSSCSYLVPCHFNGSTPQFVLYVVRFEKLCLGLEIPPLYPSPWTQCCFYSLFSLNTCFSCRSCISSLHLQSISFFLLFTSSELGCHSEGAPSFLYITPLHFIHYLFQSFLSHIIVPYF